MKLESSKEKYSSRNQEVNRKHSEGDKSSTHPTESVDSLKLTALDLGNNSASVSSSSDIRRYSSWRMWRWEYGSMR
uniref:Uncharacterized protein n=1 Tax=Triticum urartu TaxID=4572 RepID=A0A8R7JVJ9_TRIUA